MAAFYSINIGLIAYGYRLYPVLYPVLQAGADIKEMASVSFAEAYVQDLFKESMRLGNIRKPVGLLHLRVDETSRVKTP